METKPSFQSLFPSSSKLSFAELSSVSTRPRTPKVPKERHLRLRAKDAVCLPRRTFPQPTLLRSSGAFETLRKPTSGFASRLKAASAKQPLPSEFECLRTRLLRRRAFTERLFAFAQKFGFLAERKGPCLDLDGRKQWERALAAGAASWLKTRKKKCVVVDCTGEALLQQNLVKEETPLHLALSRGRREGLPLFAGLGLCVPYDKKSQTGWRSLGCMNSLRRKLRAAKEAPGDEASRKAFSDRLVDLLNRVGARRQQRHSFKGEQSLLRPLKGKKRWK